MKKIHLHPLTIPVFILLFFINKNNVYFSLYLFIFLHEMSHTLCALLLKEKISSIHLFPWGCMLSLLYAPSKEKSILILLSGPLFNFLMLVLGIFPKENLSLMLFNLIPVMPLDGGVILNLVFPKHYFKVSLIFIASLLLLYAYTLQNPSLPLLLLLLFALGRKRYRKNSIDFKVIDYLSKNNVENKAEKLYNIKIEK